MSAIKLFDTSSQLAGTVGVHACAYWAKCTQALLLLNLRKFKAAYDVLEALSQVQDVRQWDGISFVPLGSERTYDGKYLCGQMLHEWAVMLAGLGEIDRALPYFELNGSLLDDSSLLSPGMAQHNYSNSVARDAVSRMHLAWGERVRRIVGDVPAPKPRNIEPSKRLKIGYISPDMHRHVVMYFLLPCLQPGLRDSDEVHITLYSCGEKFDDFSGTLKGLADKWVSVSKMSSQAVAELIRNDKIDILVDLAGHAVLGAHDGGHGVVPLHVLAHQPAPVQATWIGASID